MADDAIPGPSNTPSETVSHSSKENTDTEQYVKSPVKEKICKTPMKERTSVNIYSDKVTRSSSPKKSITISPQGKSRYGRAHKPKVNDEFLSTDKKVGAILGISPVNSPHKTGNDISSPKSQGRPKKIKRSLWSVQSPKAESHSTGKNEKEDTPSGDVKAEQSNVDEIAVSRLTGNVLFSEVKVEGCDFVVGDIVWARIGGHPFWPCIIVIDPDVNSFSKRTTIRAVRHSVHVQFYADRGRRSWVSVSALLPFEGRESFLKRAEALLPMLKKKDRKLSLAYIIKPLVQKNWDLAVAEAEDAVKLTRLQRVQEFARRFPVKTETTKEKLLEQFKEELENAKSATVTPKRGRPLKRKIESLPFEASPPKKMKPDVETNIVKMETSMEVEAEEDSVKEVSPVKRRSVQVQQESNQVKTSEKLKSSVTRKKNKNKDMDLEKAFQSFSFSQTEIIKEDNPSMSDKDIDMHLRSLWDTMDESRRAVYYSKFAVGTSSDGETSDEESENKPTKRKERKISKEKNYTKDKNIEDKSSDESEKNEKEVEQTPTDPSSVQATYNKKGINLFRGMKTEKVCQICENSVNTIKCRGPCCGTFHLDCAKSKWPGMSFFVVPQSVQKSNSNNNILDLNVKKLDSNGLVKKVATTDNNGVSQDSSVSNGADECAVVSASSEISENDLPSAKDDKSVSEVSSVSTQEGADESDMRSPSRTLRSRHSSLLQPSSSESNESLIESSDNSKVVETPGKKKLENNKTKGNGKRRKNEDSPDDEPELVFRCGDCLKDISPPCFVCGKLKEPNSGNDKRQRCVASQCGKFYHIECLLNWPQTSFTENGCLRKSPGVGGSSTLTCPQHTCHTCASDDPRNATTRLAHERLVRCIRCPTAYHNGNYCIPAGSEILNTTQIICPRHYKPLKKIIQHVNASWCFICATGGSLICCDLCPTSFHADCLQITPPEGGYICEDCETGRYPLYGEIVWVKLGQYRWWPAQILFPSEIPDNIMNLTHTRGEFAVRFFGSHDYYWVNRGRVFLYQEGDEGHRSSRKSSVDETFSRAVKEASEAQKVLSLAKANRDAETRIGMKPPYYVKIKTNKPIGNVRVSEPDMFHMTPCECDPQAENPCGRDSDCINRILMVECLPAVCPAKDRCNNQRFEKRQYPPLTPYLTERRGWGLKTLADIKKGDFVIEYVGEMIDEAEYKRRLEQKYKEKDENYYFLTIDKDRMLDAGPKGNVARFMNHSCQPNCETQKWTVNGDTRVGLFALMDIPANTELTFNYNLESAGSEKKTCMCGAPNCSGFIGNKAVKQVLDTEKKQGDKRRKKKRIISEKLLDQSCFKCGGSGILVSCDRKSCTKSYHVECAGLKSPPKDKWICPWHFCNICKKQTTQHCHYCISAFCFTHMQGKMKVNSSQQMVCLNHGGETSKSSSNDSRDEQSEISEQGLQDPECSEINGQATNKENVVENIDLESSTRNVLKFVSPRNSSEDIIAKHGTNVTDSEKKIILLPNETHMNGDTENLLSTSCSDLERCLTDSSPPVKRRRGGSIKEGKNILSGKNERKEGVNGIGFKDKDGNVHKDLRSLLYSKGKRWVSDTTLNDKMEDLVKSLEEEKTRDGLKHNSARGRTKSLGTNMRGIHSRQNNIVANKTKMGTLDKFLIKTDEVKKERNITEGVTDIENIQGDSSSTKALNGIADLSREIAVVFGV